jgi:hypothetical protein
LLAVQPIIATTSEMPTRPPGLSAWRMEANTAGFSVDALIAQCEITTSTLSEGPRIFRIGNPLRFSIGRKGVNAETASIVYS